ncbi:MAG: DUF932 domain-containing protein, partial [Verrucomicrobiota bacterium]
MAAEVVDFAPGVILLNSYDRTSGYRIHAGLFRWGCRSGLMGAGSLIPSRHVRHTGHELPEIIREGRELGARLISLAASELGVEDGTPVLPRNGDDRIPTHDALARAVVEHFLPCGRIVEPSSGNGAFLRALPKGGDWFEYDSGM